MHVYVLKHTDKRKGKDLTLMRPIPYKDIYIVTNGLRMFHFLIGTLPAFLVLME